MIINEFHEYQLGLVIKEIGSTILNGLLKDHIKQYQFEKKNTSKKVFPVSRLSSILEQEELSIPMIFFDETNRLHRLHELGGLPKKYTIC